MVRPAFFLFAVYPNQTSKFGFPCNTRPAIRLDILKKISSRWRIYGGFEGSQDEFELITEAQLHLNRNMLSKLNNAFDATAKATDWAPEIGIIFIINR